MTKQRAIFELIFASLLWGFGFIATIWALTEYTSAELLFLRFLFAFSAGFLIYFLIKKQFVWPELKREFGLGIVPGIFLGVFMLLQTVGMETTTATKSGFITTIYVLFVPILNQLFFKHRSRWEHYALALFALAGTYLLMGANLEKIVIGDYITLAGALAGAFHIIAVGIQTKKSQDAFLLNAAQSFWTFLVFIPFVFAQDQIHLNPGFHLSFYGVLFLALGSSLLAFTIQMRTQKILSDELASQLFLLEAPASFFFAYLLLSETLTGIQLFGAAAIIMTSYLSVRIPVRRLKGH